MKLGKNEAWHLKSELPALQKGLLARLADEGAVPPLRVRGPAAMHAVFYREPVSGRSVVCLVNDFGWFQCSQEASEAGARLDSPPPCRGVVVEVTSGGKAERAMESVTGQTLSLRREGEKAAIAVPEFAVMACVVIE